MTMGIGFGITFGTTLIARNRDLAKAKKSMMQGNGKMELPEFIAKTKELIKMYEDGLITDEQLWDQLPLEPLMLTRIKKKNPSGRLTQHQPPIQNLPGTLAHKLSWAMEGKRTKSEAFKQGLLDGLKGRSTFDDQS